MLEGLLATQGIDVSINGFTVRAIPTTRKYLSVGNGAFIETKVLQLIMKEDVRFDITKNTSVVIQRPPIQEGGYSEWVEYRVIPINGALFERFSGEGHRFIRLNLVEVNNI